ncbi:PAS domain-containing hybrid sensor histidine kinase/response regulator [Pseudidiomarina taiwanensis]|uniref:histidine kinase n=1 Tax=Pseudidiomarina taiwanensis TaxID=337250 RepID=A0A432ZCE7_9GAMM|nr:PAS domain-containing hybrid sensor histidine kinase/response regulator [Pseudidiomarina taiwanensis]RUO75647.1 sodium:proline symporter [Pseudidiomarina taiwanensis]
MLSTTVAILLAISYIALLYSIAYRGERKPANQIRPYRYALAQGIHCTTWAFYGTITQSAHYGWAMAPTYLGAIAVFLFAHRIQLRLLTTCKQQNFTSIADVIGSRFGKTSGLAMVVSLIALIGIVPYIALQLRAVTASFGAATQLDTVALPWFGDLAGLVALAMMGFAILFGTRRLSLAEQHNGLMDAVAFESVVKLVAFLAVGVYVTYGVFDGISDIVLQAATAEVTQDLLRGQANGSYVYVTHVLLGAISMFCLPRQFQVSYIENTDPEELRTARWAFPLYLFAINLFILPIALAGMLLVPAAATSDTFMLALLQQTGSLEMTMVAFVGGLASATSMVIIATLALSIMMSNDVVMPLWLKLTQKRLRKLTFSPAKVLGIRRGTIVIIMLLAFGFHKLTEANLPLVNAGLLSLALLAQLAPPLLGGLVWRRANRAGAIAGLGIGTVLWFALLLWPSLPGQRGLSDVAMSDGILLSLALNLLLFIVGSLLFKASSTERTQGHLFYEPYSSQVDIDPQQNISWGRLRQVLNRIFDSVEIDRLSQKLQTDLTLSAADEWVPKNLLARIERELAAVIGSAASRILLTAITQQTGVPIAQAVSWATQASQLYKFNRELLQASVENIPQGISVVDQDLKLVAWNHRYIEVFQYPPGFLQAGMPVAELLRYNAERGLFGNTDSDDLDAEVDKRLNYLKAGSAYRYQRQQGDQVIELQGSPMPDGGFVTTYTDITELVAAQRQLETINLQLEQRVDERTAELLLAKQAEEQAHRSKTRFFAAVSHDLMQPFNAATLFCEMLLKRVDAEPAQLAQQIQQALTNAEELLTQLLDMTRLEAGNLQVNRQQIAIDEVLRPLVAGQAIIANNKGLELRYTPTNAIVSSDRRLLSRVIQNLLSNAVRYTERGHVEITFAATDTSLAIAIKDTGRGIPADQQADIFREFHQLENDHENPGIGLGLAIVERMCRLLEMPLELESKQGQGTTFKLELPLVGWQQDASSEPQIAALSSPKFLQGQTLWVVDNDQRVLLAMEQLLSDWGAHVVTAKKRQDLPLTPASQPPSLVILDYHLDDGDTGIEVLIWLRQQLNCPDLPALLNSADPDEVLREQAIAERASFMPKPLKTAALMRLLKRLLR